MKLNQLTSSQRILAGLGCVVVLALLAASAGYVAFDVISQRRLARELAGAPPSWADSLRAMGRAPSLAGFGLERGVDADGAGIAHDSAQRWHRGSVEGAYRALVGGGATRGDSALWREIAGDTALDRFVAAARMRQWHALDRVLAGADSAVRRNIMLLPVPAYAPVRNAARGLVIRGLERLRRADGAGARTDLGAAVALGEQIFRREPSAVGSFMGKSVIASGAHGWARYAALTRDPALEARANTVLAWASAPPSRVAELLLVAPDTALALARDSTLALGVRGEALLGTVNAWMLRPRGFIFGPPRRYRDALRALERDPDPDLARLAAMTGATSSRQNVWGRAALLRELRP